MAIALRWTPRVSSQHTGAIVEAVVSLVSSLSEGSSLVDANARPPVAAGPVDSSISVPASACDSGLPVWNGSTAVEPASVMKIGCSPFDVGEVPSPDAVVRVNLGTPKLGGGMPDRVRELLMVRLLVVELVAVVVSSTVELLLKLVPSAVSGIVVVILASVVLFPDSIDVGSGFAGGLVKTISPLASVDSLLVVGWLVGPGWPVKMGCVSSGAAVTSESDSLAVVSAITDVASASVGEMPLDIGELVGSMGVLLIPSSADVFDEGSVSDGDAIAVLSAG